jgi:hypothetical protein
VLSPPTEGRGVGHIIFSEILLGCFRYEDKFIIELIKTKNDYQAALKKIKELFEAKLNTPNKDLLEVLTTLIEAYVQKHFNIASPDPIEVIKFRM